MRCLLWLSAAFLINEEGGPGPGPTRQRAVRAQRRETVRNARDSPEALRQILAETKQAFLDRCALLPAPDADLPGARALLETPPSEDPAQRMQDLLKKKLAEGRITRDEYEAMLKRLPAQTRALREPDHVPVIPAGATRSSGTNEWASATAENGNFNPLQPLVGFGQDVANVTVQGTRAVVEHGFVNPLHTVVVNPLQNVGQWTAGLFHRDSQAEAEVGPTGVRHEAPRRAQERPGTPQRRERKDPRGLTPSFAAAAAETRKRTPRVSPRAVRSPTTPAARSPKEHNPLAAMEFGEQEAFRSFCAKMQAEEPTSGPQDPKQLLRQVELITTAIAKTEQVPRARDANATSGAPRPRMRTVERGAFLSTAIFGGDSYGHYVVEEGTDVETTALLQVLEGMGMEQVGDLGDHFGFSVAMSLHAAAQLYTQWDDPQARMQAVGRLLAYGSIVGMEVAGVATQPFGPIVAKVCVFVLERYIFALEQEEESLLEQVDRVVDAAFLKHQIRQALSATQAVRAQIADQELHDRLRPDPKQLPEAVAQQEIEALRKSVAEAKWSIVEHGLAMQLPGLTPPETGTSSGKVLPLDLRRVLAKPLLDHLNMHALTLVQMTGVPELLPVYSGKAARMYLEVVPQLLLLQPVVQQQLEVRIPQLLADAHSFVPEACEDERIGWEWTEKMAACVWLPLLSAEGSPPGYARAELLRAPEVEPPYVNGHWATWGKDVHVWYKVDRGLEVAPAGDVVVLPKRDPGEVLCPAGTFVEWVEARRDRAPMAQRAVTFGLMPSNEEPIIKAYQCAHSPSVRLVERTRFASELPCGSLTTFHGPEYAEFLKAGRSNATQFDARTFPARTLAWMVGMQLNANRSVAKVVCQLGFEWRDEPFLPLGVDGGEVQVFDPVVALPPEQRGYLLPSGPDGQVVATLETTVTSVAAAAGFAFVGTEDGGLGMWHDGKEQQRFAKGGKDVVKALHVAGRYLLSASGDTVRMYGLASGLEVRAFPHDSPVLALTVDGVHMYTGAADGVARAWNLESGQQVKAYAHSGEPINAVAVGGGKVVTGGKGVQVWGATTGELLGDLEHPAEVTALALSPDGKFLVAGTKRVDAEGAAEAERLTVHLWSLETGAKLRKFAAESTVVALALRGASLFCANEADSAVQLWSLDTGAEHTELMLRMHQSGALGADVGPFVLAGGRLVTGGRLLGAPVVQQWDLPEDVAVSHLWT